MSQVFFRAPSWSRLASFYGEMPKHSFLRCLEYERMTKVNLTGRVLDLGGGSVTKYSARVPTWGTPSDFTYESANIDEAAKPTYLITPGEKLPIEDDRYDVVIALNTFEHIYDLHTPLSEASRILVPGGRLIFIVPFIFRVHGHPEDFHRGTPLFWSEMLKTHGFAPPAIEALTWGPFVAASTISGLPGPLKVTRRRIAAAIDILHSKLKGQQEESWAQQDDRKVNIALAYFVEARKAAPSPAS